ncbi:ABC transporter substrate-binding protein [Roseisalinus antarcticus]|uniref:sn-glycerol-3-phosphate-binding periplasmic protein UgpB n=1 Tax=Roseisalinus antarcticus TaxID=254357 RepID=A0A1Y5T6Z3_9RHOB|nr:extracellular solute-binding protein [Roseisalinus antarcticus]SLN57336.1 sn-glycerol-3-phosphate-binding periplasmic protein UgpB precursor [Roseisalinus antarcticus]
MQPNDQYYTLLGTALSSGQGPDLFLLNGGAQARARMDALTDVTASADGLVGLAEFESPEGAVMALPITIQGFVVYYNKARYEEAGLDPDAPPQTWEELVSVCEAITAAGEVPCFSLGNKEGFAAEFFLSAIAASTLTDEQHSAFAAGDLAWSSPEISEILSLWVETNDMGWYPRGANSTAKFMDEYEQFMRGDAANTIGLLSDVAHWKQFEDFLGAEGLGVYRHPAPDMVSDHPMMPVAGGIGYGVNAASAKADLALELAQTLAAAGPIQTFVNDAGVVPANTMVDTSGLSSPAAGTILGWLDGSSAQMAHANVTAEELAEWHRQSQLLLNGETTVADAAARMDEVQAAAHGG